MKLDLLRLAGLLLISTGLMACAASPTRYYTLVPPAADARPARPGYAVEVQSVQLPSQVDQPQFVLRQGPGKLALAEQHQWIAPLPQEYRAALSSALHDLLGAPDVYRSPKPADLPIYPIRVRVQRFDSQLSSLVRQEVLWSLAIPDGTTVMTCLGVFEQLATGGYLELAEAHQQVVRRVADTIASSLTQMIDGQTPTCP